MLEFLSSDIKALLENGNPGSGRISYKTISINQAKNEEGIIIIELVGMKGKKLNGMGT